MVSGYEKKKLEQLNSLAKPSSREQSDPFKQALNEANTLMAQSVVANAKKKIVEEHQAEAELAEAERRRATAERIKAEGEEEAAKARVEGKLEQKVIQQDRMAAVESLIRSGFSFDRAVELVMAPATNTGRDVGLPLGMSDFTSKVFTKALEVMDKGGQSQQQPQSLLNMLASEVNAFAAVKKQLEELSAKPEATNEQRIQAGGLIRTLDDHIKLGQWQFDEWKERVAFQNELKLKWLEYDDKKERLDKFASKLDELGMVVQRVLSQPGQPGQPGQPIQSPNKLANEPSPKYLYHCSECDAEFSGPPNMKQIQCPNCNAELEVKRAE